MTTASLIPASLQADIDLMESAAVELARITERTEFALSVVTQAIKTQEAIAKGKVLTELRDKIPDGEWMKFLNREDVRLDHRDALRFINAAQLVEEATPLYGEEMLMNFGSTSLSLMKNLPADVKVEILDKAEETGKAPTNKNIREISAKPETKLSKAQEQLAEAKAKKEDASKSHDKWKAGQDIQKFENRIKQLESELEREKEQKSEISDGLTTAEDDLHKATRKLEQAQADLAKALEDSDRLRFDEDTARQQRVSRVGNQLVLTIPQTMADVQKFVADQEHFPEKTRSTIENQVHTLMAYLNEHFTQNKSTEQNTDC